MIKWLLTAALGIGIQSASPPGKPVAHELAGTSWQLVRFQGSDDTTLTPDDKTKYTLQFGADNRVAVRFDCNRGSGPWQSAKPPQLEFGPMAMTRAFCAPPSTITWSSSGPSSAPT